MGKLEYVLIISLALLVVSQIGLISEMRRVHDEIRFSPTDTIENHNYAGVYVSATVLFAGIAAVAMFLLSRRRKNELPTIDAQAAGA